MRPQTVKYTYDACVGNDTSYCPVLVVTRVTRAGGARTLSDALAPRALRSPFVYICLFCVLPRSYRARRPTDRSTYTTVTKAFKASPREQQTPVRYQHTHTLPLDM